MKINSTTTTTTTTTNITTFIEDTSEKIKNIIKEGTNSFINETIKALPKYTISHPLFLAIGCDLISKDWNSNLDADEDGFTIEEGDCWDSPQGPLGNIGLQGRDIHPGAADIPYDGIDSDCMDDDDFDADLDGYRVSSVQGDDCDDTNADINPDATEVCTLTEIGSDENCDGNFNFDDVNSNSQFDFGGTEGVSSADGSYSTNEFYLDSDGDGYGGIPVAACGTADQVVSAIDAGNEVYGFYSINNQSISIRLNDLLSYADSTFVSSGDDCDDTSAAFQELSTWYADSDHDSFGDPNQTQTSCIQPSGFVADNTDCNDTDFTTNPNAADVCDSKDNNCDNQIDIASDGTSSCN